MSHDPSLIQIDPQPRFSLSPYLYMQFMEPLGTTDSSVEAGWDFGRNCWREDLVNVTRELAPPLVRWGGCLSSYYRWKEAVGPRRRRVPMRNLLWGGVETNQVGTHEFVDFCRQVGADRLININFESDGRKHWARPAPGEVRSGSAREAAQWVDYCNRPAHGARAANGSKEPLGVRLWQIGNETSYDPNGFDCETTAKLTLRFARAMREADPDIQLIGWADNGWARRVAEVAGEELNYLAFHHHFDSGLPNSPLRGADYLNDPGLTWRHLMHACHSTEAKIQQMRAETASLGIPLAMTESHFALPGRNRCEVLSTWAAGVANARILNAHTRNGDILKIATLADFCGTRWMVNAVMIPTPEGAGGSYMMPVARVMSLYRKHVGKRAITIDQGPADLDITASRTGSRLFLHVVNTNRTQPVRTRLAVRGAKFDSVRVFEIAVAPEFQVMETCADALAPIEKKAPDSGVWTFPAASVSAVEIRCNALQR